MNQGYEVYFQIDSDTILRFPIAPEKINMKVGSNNKVVSLINQGDVNIIRPPGLAEIEFDARFPMHNYPYATGTNGYSSYSTMFRAYYDLIKNLKVKKQTFRFIVTRKTIKNSRSWDTNELVTLEDFEIQEDAGEGDDVIISFKLKQYVEYSAKKIITTSNNTVKEEPVKTPTTTTNKTQKSEPYTVRKGDCLWNIAIKYYGNKNATKWTKIYNANKTIIEKTAKKYGYKSSNNGWWIFPGTKLTIPPL